MALEGIGWWFGKLTEFTAWAGKWLSALRQWDEIEAGFASNYGMSLDDVMSITWRRFTVLFGGIFKWNQDLPKPEGATGNGRIADTVDWSNLSHRPVKEITGGGLAGMGVKVEKVPTKVTDG